MHALESLDRRSLGARLAKVAKDPAVPLQLGNEHQSGTRCRESDAKSSAKSLSVTRCDEERIPQNTLTLLHEVL